MASLPSGSGQDIPLQDLQEGIQLLRCGVPAEGDPERTVDDLWGCVHGGEHMAAVALGTGASGGDANRSILKQIDCILNGNAGDGKRENMGRFVAAVDSHARKLRKLLYKSFKHCPLPGGIFPEGGGDCPAGGGKAENSGSGFGAAAVAALLPAAQKEGGEGFEPGANIEGARPLGAVDFMRGNADKIRAQGLCLERKGRGYGALRGSR